MSEETTNPESTTESTGAEGSEKASKMSGSDVPGYVLSFDPKTGEYSTRDITPDDLDPVESMLGFIISNVDHEIRHSKIAASDAAAVGDHLGQPFHDGRVHGATKVLLLAMHYAAFRAGKKLRVPDAFQVDLRDAMTRRNLQSDVNRWMAIAGFIVSCADSAKYLLDIVQCGPSVESSDWKFAAEHIEKRIAGRYRELFGCELGK